MSKKEVVPEYRCDLHTVHNCPYRSYGNYCQLVVDLGHAKCSCDYRYESTVLEEFIPEEGLSFTASKATDTEDLPF